MPPPPKWIKPQSRRLVDEAPSGVSSLHEIKYDGNACMLASTVARSSC